MEQKNWIRLLSCLIVLFLLLPVCTVQGAEMDRLTMEKQVYAYLTSQMGLNSAAACGIMANIEVESGFTLTAIGDSGTSFGLCQWHEGRYTALITYCASRGLDYRSLMGQLEYLQYELRTNYTSLLAQLNLVEDSAQGAYQAGYLWCVKFERPADMEVKGVTRGNLAQYKYWYRYRGASLPAPEDNAAFAAEMLEQMEAPVSRGVVEEWRLEEAPTEEAQVQGQTGVHRSRARIRAYIPHHHPVSEPAPENAATGMSVGLTFLVLGDGVKKRWLPLPEAEDVPLPAA